MHPGQFSPLFTVTILMVIGLGVTSLLAAATWFTHGLQRRQNWDHQERMKALEMGFYVPPRESPWPRTFACVSIGVLVPLGTFVCAWLASIDAPDTTQAIVWGVAFLVSTTAVGCATSLAPGLPTRSTDRLEETRSTAKPPAFDPESFEVVNGSRHGRG